MLLARKAWRRRQDEGAPGEERLVDAGWKPAFLGLPGFSILAHMLHTQWRDCIEEGKPVR
jgi:hypothetical protein